MSTEQSSPSAAGNTGGASVVPVDKGPVAAVSGDAVGPTGRPVTGGRSRHQRPTGPLEPSQQAEAAGQLVAMSFPGARRIAGWLFWVIFPVLCVGAIYISAENFAHHVGKKPAGVRGTFVVQPRSCSGGFCSFGGLFTSDDQKIRNLPLIGDPRWRTGEVHQVVYDRTKVEVGALPGHWDPTASVVSVLGALTYLIVVGYFYRAERTYRAEQRVRAQPAAAA